MRSIQPRHDLLVTMYLPIAVVCLLTPIFFPHQVWLALHISWLWLIAAIAEFISQRYRLAAVQSTRPNIPVRYKPLAYLTKLWGLQLGSLLAFLGLLIVITRGIPSPNSQLPAVNHTLLQALKYLHWHWGLYPWGLYALYAIRLDPNQQSSDLVRFARLSGKGSASVSTNFCLKQSLLLVIVTSLGFFIWYFSALAGFVSHISMTYGWRIKALFISSALFLPLLQSKTLQGLTIRLKPSFRLYQLCCIVFLLAMALLLLANFATDWIQANYPPLPPHAALPNWQWLNTTDWRIYWWAWWLCWSPLMAKVIAKLSPGYKKSTIIASCLILPLIISLLLWLCSDNLLLSILAKLSHSPLLLPGLSLILFFAFLTYTPLEKFLTPVGVSPPLHNIRYPVIYSILTFATIYLVVGISIPAALAFLAALPCSVLLGITLGRARN